MPDRDLTALLEGGYEQASQIPAGVDTSRPTSPGSTITCFRALTISRLTVSLPSRSRRPRWRSGTRRGFRQRAAKWIVQQDVRQFVHIGSGLPTVGNTRDVVLKVIPVANKRKRPSGGCCHWGAFAMMAPAGNRLVALTTRACTRRAELLAS